MTVPKVLLIVMPFFSTVAPAAGPSILKPRLAAEGIACDIVYLNIDFAAMIGHSLFERICESKSDGGETLIGERIFAEEFFPGQLPDDHDYRRYLQKVYAEAAGYFEGFLAAKRYVRPFLDTCLSTIPWEKYDAFGFSTMFEQTLASLTLARRLKERFPGKAIIFGGSNCEGEMGIELHRCFPFIDFVCCGEADATLPELVKRLSAGLAMDDLPGVVRRTGSESVLAAPPQLWEELDALPYPDYDDYFARLHHASLPFPERGLIMETSRGCWWGARSQCRFCGLNPNSIAFRAKEPKRVVAELDHLIDRYCRPYGVQSLTMVDNILPMVFFRSLFPELAEHRLPVRIFYEVKANLSPEQLRLLADAGIAWVQPGIESLSSHVLRLMAKGVTALQNVQFLKSCLRYGVQPVWNFINGIPGEREEDYQEMLSLIEKIHHLPPPSGHSRFELQRFSPFFAEPQRYGIVDIRPKEAYRFVYPFDWKGLSRLAYHFDFDYLDEVRPPRLDRELKEAIARWQECAARGEQLRAIHRSSSLLLIEDTRRGARLRRFTLDGIGKDIYDFCDRARSFFTIVSYLREQHPYISVRPRDVRDFLQQMAALDLMATENDRFLSLAVSLNGALRRE